MSINRTDGYSDIFPGDSQWVLSVGATMLGTKPGDSLRYTQTHTRKHTNAQTHTHNTHTRTTQQNRLGVRMSVETAAQLATPHCLIALTDFDV
jgi:hypothetical protein